MVNVDHARDLSNRGAVAAQLIGMDHLWNVIFIQKASQEDLRRFSVLMPLEKNVEREAVLVDCSPQPVSNTVYARTHLVETPPGTSSGFPVAQVFSEEGAELDAPLAQGFVADLNAALVQ